MRLVSLIVTLVACEATSETDVTYADVEPLIADNCLGCHGDPLANGAPFAIDSFETASASADRIVARAVDDEARPMPPSGLVFSEDEGELLREWAAAGAPR